MKTATVTWISYNNYGTVLQAYALQKKIEQLGFKNEILDDSIIIHEQFCRRKNTTIEKKEAKTLTLFERIMRLCFEPGALHRAILLRKSRSRYTIPYEDSQKHIISFKKGFLNIRDIQLEKMELLNNDYDVFIAGSDQIWSVFTDVFNPYYYLNFVQKKKISYAPSMGTDSITKEIESRISELLEGYDSISVREKTSSNLLSTLLDREVYCVADPTLLHNKEFWSLFAKKPHIKRKYLLCYFLEDKDWYFDYAKTIAKKLKLKIVLIPSRREYLTNGYVYDGVVGPQEFVGLFEGAEFVLTDSYHGSIFSLLFERNFHHLLRFEEKDTYSQNIRVNSLFSILDINDRIVKKDQINMPSIEMNYFEISKRIKEFREYSLDYLNKSLSGE